MSDTIWAAIITSISALLAVVIKGIFDLKKIKLETKNGEINRKELDNRPSAKFFTYLWQTPKIKILYLMLLVGFLVYNLFTIPEPITAYFVYSVAFNFAMIAFIVSSILIFYLIRLTSGLLKQPDGK